MSGAPDTLAVRAPAKINLFLRVLRRRDDGYHDLESLIVPISLADRLVVHAAADATAFRTLSLSLEVTGDPALIRGVPANESNLVLRAARLLAERTEVRGFADIGLEKRVPAAAGLGGGSSDAAATLRALHALWGANLSPEELRHVAAAVGSDVPALLAGRPVLVSGRGEVVRDTEEPTAFRIALVTFDFGVRTADAYRWWDEDGGPSAEAAAAIAGRPVSNDLEPPVMERHPRIRQARELLLRAGADAAVMCGSGPSVAGFLPNEAGALDAAAEAALAEVSGRPVRYAGPLGSRP